MLNSLGKYKKNYECLRFEVSIISPRVKERFSGVDFLFLFLAKFIQS